MNQYMTASEFEQEIKRIKNEFLNDPELAKDMMVRLMVIVLRQRGFDAGCNIFEGMK